MFRHLIFNFIIYLTCLALTYGQSEPFNNKRDIETASRAFDDAQFNKDKASLNVFLAEDFNFVKSTGEFTDRNGFISIFIDPTVTFEKFIITNREILEFGTDVATVIADGIILGKTNNDPFKQHFRYADTFVKRNGEWKVVYVQVTPIIDSN
ncbi:MAG: nuclear transport factor 2 family protein [Kordiimonadaceae bacterium]|nr:nuclear transport factor 2 family protein [Kordiimonadaceae bacterium]